VAGALQQQQHELGVVQPRLSRLEALESSNPRASLRLVTALEGKLDNLSAQQVRLPPMGTAVHTYMHIATDKQGHSRKP
jgi:hypothetical protein